MVSSSSAFHISKKNCIFALTRISSKYFCLFFLKLSNFLGGFLFSSTRRMRQFRKKNTFYQSYALLFVFLFSARLFIGKLFSKFVGHLGQKTEHPFQMFGLTFLSLKIYIHFHNFALFSKLPPKNNQKFRRYL